MLRNYFRPLRARIDSIVIPYTVTVRHQTRNNGHNPVRIHMAVADKNIIIRSLIRFWIYEIRHIPSPQKLFLFPYAQIHNYFITIAR